VQPSRDWGRGCVNLEFGRVQAATNVLGSFGVRKGVKYETSSGQPSARILGTLCELSVSFSAHLWSNHPHRSIPSPSRSSGTVDIVRSVLFTYGFTLSSIKYPLYTPGGTTSVLVLAVERRQREIIGNSLYTSARYATRWVAFRKQNQVRQLEDTWPIDGLCIYKYQLGYLRRTSSLHSPRF
jgi:hypothetical protein